MTAMDDLIDDLLSLEKDAQALITPFLREDVGALYSESLIRALEALRDCRWQMMAVRADSDREGQEAAPTFSDSGALRLFLDGLSS
jgi:hypothetical protein